MDEIIIIGAGFSGSILARELAEKLNYKVRVIEKRAHIGGNAYDEKDRYGIIVQKYGPHFLNTNNYHVINYLKKFTSLIPYDVKLMSYIDGKYIRLPFNFKTMQQLVGYENSETLLKKMRKYFTGRDRVPIMEIMKCSDSDIQQYANLLFEKAYKTYTSKQWGLNPNQIDRSVMDRVPMAMNFDERYLNKDFQYLPENGFTEIFENMLNHPNITVELNTDALKDIQFNEGNRNIYFRNKRVKLLIYTGAIDELFQLKFGRLPYRSLNITYDYEKKDKILPCEIISYPQAEGYTRKTEYKQINFHCTSEYTVIATEYPLEYNPNDLIANIPYYPTLTNESIEKYQLYLKEAEKYNNIFLCGRLAEFKYYNMDVCIEHALKRFKEIEKCLEYSV